MKRARRICILEVHTRLVTQKSYTILLPRIANRFSFSLSNTSLKEEDLYLVWYFFSARLRNNKPDKKENTILK